MHAQLLFDTNAWRLLFLKVINDGIDIPSHSV